MSSISSDSELEEFVDALDESQTVQDFRPRVESPVGQTDDVEEEERRILKLQKKAEERRKKEDGEIKKRWEEVKKKKEEERIQSLEEQKWKAEESLRRRKLEGMRQRMLEEATPTKSHNSSSSEEDDPVWEDGSDVSENIEPVDFKIQNFAPNILNTEELGSGEVFLDNSYNENTCTVIQTASVASSRTAREATPVFSEPVSVLSSESETSFKDAKSDTNLHEEKTDNLLRNLPADRMNVYIQGSVDDSCSKFDDFLQNQDLSFPIKEKTSKDIPQITCKDYEAENSDVENPPTEKQELDDYTRNPELTLEQEPDIVKSAKPRLPPQSLMPPVAPPRRKKKKVPTATLR